MAEPMATAPSPGAPGAPDAPDAPEPTETAPEVSEGERPSRRLRTRAAFVMASILTAAVAGPLAFQALDADIGLFSQLSDDAADQGNEPSASTNGATSGSSVAGGDTIRSETTLDLTPYSPEGFVAVTADGEVSLDGLTLAGEVMLQVASDDLESVAFALISNDGSVIQTAEDTEGPSYDFAPNATGGDATFDTRSLSDGTYALLATMTFSDDPVERRAAEFIVANEGVAD